MSNTWNNWDDCIWIGTMAECVGGPIDGEIHVIKDQIMTVYSCGPYNPKQAPQISTHLYKYDGGKYHYIGLSKDNV